MKKFLMIGLVIAGFAFASVPRSEAGISVGIGFGYPGYSYGSYPYGYYPYGCYRPYAYYHRPYYRTAFYSGPRWYWHRGHKVYNRRHYRY